MSSGRTGQPAAVGTTPSIGCDLLGAAHRCVMGFSRVDELLITGRYILWRCATTNDSVECPFENTNS